VLGILGSEGVPCLFLGKGHLMHACCPATHRLFLASPPKGVRRGRRNAARVAAQRGGVALCRHVQHAQHPVLRASCDTKAAGPERGAADGRVVLGLQQVGPEVQGPYAQEPGVPARGIGVGIAGVTFQSLDQRQRCSRCGLPIGTVALESEVTAASLRTCHRLL
jgi:hypothetical protein